MLALVEIGDRLADLHPDELALVEGSVAKRQREFSSARYAAHIAGRELGQELAPVLRDGERRPLWPAGWVGSLSHSHQLAAALVATNAELSGVGIDIEAAGRVQPDLHKRLFTPIENARMQGDPARVFSAKEAVYKAVNPIAGRYIEFTDVEVIDLGDQRFRMRYLGRHDAERVMEQGQGYWTQFAGDWISVFWLPVQRFKSGQV